MATYTLTFIEIVPEVNSIGRAISSYPYVPGEDLKAANLKKLTQLLQENAIDIHIWTDVGNQLACDLPNGDNEAVVQDCFFQLPAQTDRSQDALYVSWCPDVSKPEPTESNHSGGSYPWTLWPIAGAWPASSGGYVSTVDNQIANANDVVLEGLAEGAVCFWDYRSWTSDVMLIAFKIDDSSCGEFVRIIYNADQDCIYIVNYTLEKVS